jgi:hypothetical protein
MPKTSGSISSGTSLTEGKVEAFINKAVHNAVGNAMGAQIQQLTKTFQKLQTENQLLKHENKTLRNACNVEKQRRKRGKPLFRDITDNGDCRAVFYSPTKIQEARDYQDTKQQEKDTEAARKAEDKLQKQIQKEEKQRQVIQRKQQREVTRVLREQETAAKKAAREEAKLQREAAKQHQQELKTIRPKGKKVVKPSYFVFPPPVLLEPSVEANPRVDDCVETTQRQLRSRK